MSSEARESYASKIANSSRTGGFGLASLQAQVALWAKANFDVENGTPIPYRVDSFLGMVEELGELSDEIAEVLLAAGMARLTAKVGKISHHILKGTNQLRGTKEEHEAKIKDGIGDLVIFLCGFCEANNWNLDEIVKEVWREVGARDWKANKVDGQAPVPVPETSMPDGLLPKVPGMNVRPEDLRIGMPLVMHKYHACQACGCSQTLRPEDQQCPCRCHTEDRTAAQEYLVKNFGSLFGYR